LPWGRGGHGHVGVLADLFSGTRDECEDGYALTGFFSLALKLGEYLEWHEEQG
jgi:hypothetical protein